MAKKELFTVSFECEVLTPMFLGSSDPREAELRPPSIKGAIRFWWRAMNGRLNTGELYKKERSLFGGIPDEKDKNSNIGKSKVLVSVTSNGVRTSTTKFKERFTIKTNILDGNGRARTLDSILFLGFGKGLPKSKREGRLATEWAEYIECGSKFEVTFESLDQNKLKEFSESFRVLECFGGLGGKSRNGFGSFRINKFNQNKLDFKPLDVEKLIKGDRIPDYPAFSEFAKVIKGGTGFRSWDEAMDHLAQTYYKAKQKLTKSKQIPDSGTFGNKKEFAGMLLKDTEVHLPVMPNRIPKPFFMKISKDVDAMYSWQILYLPSRFLEGFREENSGVVDDMQEEFLAYMKLMVDQLENWDKEETE